MFLASAARMPATVQQARVTIVLAGDSTVTDEAGWGLGWQFAGADLRRHHRPRTAEARRAYRRAAGDRAQLRSHYYLISSGQRSAGKGPERETGRPRATRNMVVRRGVLPSAARQSWSRR